MPGCGPAARTVPAADAPEADPAAVDPSAVVAVGVVAARRASGSRALTFAATYPFSAHTLLLRKFLALGGVDPDREVEIVVVPPPYMIDCLEKGLIDGFCVGSPWNSLAVDQGKGAGFYNGDRVYGTGEEVRFPDLADTLEAVGRAGAGLFYEGELARRLSSYILSMGGIITEEDLATYEAIVRDPLSFDYHGRTLYTNGPPSAGGPRAAPRAGACRRGPPASRSTA